MSDLNNITIEQIEAELRHMRSDAISGDWKVTIAALELFKEITNGDFVIVPKEPTYAMQIAGRAEIDPSDNDAFNTAKHVYMAMISAAGVK